jgi:CheY-like chemotaxis protein
MAARILVLHWNAAEAAERVELLRGARFQADYFARTDSDGGFRMIRENPPDAVAIDLARLPSHGREVGRRLREHKATRHIPLVFLEGDSEKTAQTRALLPDAVFTTWPRIGAALRRALKTTIENPVVPATVAGYSGTPLPKKLRIGEGSVVALLHAPDGFRDKLVPLPPDVRFQNRADGADVILVFQKSAATLSRELPLLAREIKEGRTLWLIWPKKSSGVATDVTEPVVREQGLASGLVDFKVCAVDETWSGLAFAARRAKRANAKKR